MNFIPARGFALNGYAYGEADKILQIYTLQWGKVKAIAKGVRKPKSRLASATELFTESAFALHKKSHSDLYLLSQAKTLNGYAELKKEFRAITALQVLADILAQSLHDAEPNPELYTLLKETLGALGGNPGDLETVLSAFTLKFIDLLGHPVELDHCAECGTSLQRKGAFLIPHRGGALCPDCCPSGPSRLRMTPAGLAILRKLRGLPIAKARVLKMKPSFSRGLFLALMEYLERTIEKRIKSIEYYLKVLPAGEPA